MWFFRPSGRSRRKSRRPARGIRCARSGQVRRLGFEPLEDRRLLSVGFQILHSFTGDDGCDPTAGLTLVGSTLFGAIANGGTEDVAGGGDGTLYSISPDGTGFKVLHDFSDSDGACPYGNLTADGSTLFGTTQGYLYENGATVFSINTDGTDFQVLHSFAIGGMSTEYMPVAGLTAVGSTLVGTTEYGGPDDAGTAFSINTDGTGFQTLYSFGSGWSDPCCPRAGLTLSGSTLVGTTEYGGPDNAGTVFSIQDAPNIADATTWRTPRRPPVW